MPAGAWGARSRSAERKPSTSVFSASIPPARAPRCNAPGPAGTRRTWTRTRARRRSRASRRSRGTRPAPDVPPPPERRGPGCRSGWAGRLRAWRDLPAAQAFRDDEAHQLAAGSRDKRVEDIAVAHVLAEHVEARLEVAAVSTEPGTEREQERAWHHAVSIEDVADLAHAGVPGDRDPDPVATIARERLEQRPKEGERDDPRRHHGQPAQTALPHRRA